MTSGVAGSYEVIASGFYLEGLLVDGPEIWYTDVALGGVRRAGSETVLLEDRPMIGGLLLNQDGSLLVAGGGNIAWVDPKTGASGLLAEGFPGSNEMAPDPGGGILFGTIDLPSILRGERPGPSQICRLSPNGTLTRLYEDLAFANGLALSADGATLFFNESFAASRAFPIGRNGALGPPRLLAEKPDCDGLALDAEGNIWITGFASDHLLCLRPDGEEIRRLALPGKAASSIRFGGPDLRDLYVNIVDPEAAQRLAAGTPLTEKTSMLCRMRSPVPGAPVPRAAFTLDR